MVAQTIDLEPHLHIGTISDSVPGPILTDWYRLWFLSNIRRAPGYLDYCVPELCPDHGFEV